MEFSAEMSGFGAMKAVLDALPDRMAKNVNSFATRKAANVLKNALRDAAPVGEGKHKAGHGRDQFKVKQIRADRGGASFVVSSGKGFWLYWQEYGRGVVKVQTAKKKGMPAKVLSDGEHIFGKEVKAAPARPFARPTFDSNWEKVFNTMGFALGDGLLREAKIAAGDYSKYAKRIGIK